MTQLQPEPGQVWQHRNGERREVVVVNKGYLKYKISWLVIWSWEEDWLAWQSGATLVEGGTR